MWVQIPMFEPTIAGSETAVAAAVGVFNHNSDTELLHCTEEGLWPPSDLQFLKSCRGLMLSWICTLDLKRDGQDRLACASLLAHTTNQMTALVYDEQDDQIESAGVEQVTCSRLGTPAQTELLLQTAIRSSQATMAVLYSADAEGKVCCCCANHPPSIQTLCAAVFVCEFCTNAVF